MKILKILTIPLVVLLIPVCAMGLFIMGVTGMLMEWSGKCTLKKI